jgi:hypothetical protein
MAIDPSNMNMSQLLAAEAEDLVNPLPIGYYSPEFSRRRAAMLAAERAPLTRASRQQMPVGATGIRGADVKRWGELQGRLAAGAAEAAQRADIRQRQEMGAAALKRFRDAARAEDATRLAQMKLRQSIGRTIGGMSQEGSDIGFALAGRAKEHQEGLRERGKELASHMGKQQSYLDTLSDINLSQPLQQLQEGGLVFDRGIPAPSLDVSNRHWLDYDFSTDRPLYAGVPDTVPFSYADTLSSDS